MENCRNTGYGAPLDKITPPLQGLWLFHFIVPPFYILDFPNPIDKLPPRSLASVPLTPPEPVALRVVPFLTARTTPSAGIRSTPAYPCSRWRDLRRIAAKGLDAPGHDLQIPLEDQVPANRRGDAACNVLHHSVVVLGARQERRVVADGDGQLEGTGRFAPDDVSGVGVVGGWGCGRGEKVLRRLGDVEGWDDGAQSGVVRHLPDDDVEDLRLCAGCRASLRR
jgi:hypothetical protein